MTSATQQITCLDGRPVGQFSTADPTRRADRERFSRMSAYKQAEIRQRVGDLYDGTMTLARCWREALDELGS